MLCSCAYVVDDPPEHSFVFMTCLFDFYVFAMMHRLSSELLCEPIFMYFLLRVASGPMVT